MELKESLGGKSFSSDKRQTKDLGEVGRGKFVPERSHRVLLSYNAGHAAGKVRTPSLREGASAGEGGSKREISVPSCEKGRAGGLFRYSWGMKTVDTLCLEMGKASRR